MCVGASLRQQSRCAGANGAEGVSKFVADLLRHNLAAKGGNEGCLSGRIVRPGRANTASYIKIGTLNGCRLL